MCPPAAGFLSTLWLLSPRVVYPEIKSSVKLLFMGWNPPKPFGGLGVDDKDNLRSALHEILKELGQIESSSPDKSFLNEFLEEGFYFIHTVKCWTDATFPGFSGRLATKEEKVKGEALIQSCVRPHLDKELEDLAPQKVCVLGKVPFHGLRELFPWLTAINATPTQREVIH